MEYVAQMGHIDWMNGLYCENHKFTRSRCSGTVDARAATAPMATTFRRTFETTRFGYQSRTAMTKMTAIPNRVRRKKIRSRSLIGAEVKILSGQHMELD